MFSKDQMATYARCISLLHTTAFAHRAQDDSVAGLSRARRAC